MTDLASSVLSNELFQSEQEVAAKLKLFKCSSIAWTGGELHLACAAVRVLLRLVNLLSHRVKHLRRSVRWNFCETTDLVLVGCLESSHDLQNFNLKNVSESSSPSQRPRLPSA